MSATLKNKSRQPVVLVLDHAAFLNKASGWNRTTASFGTQTAEGKRVVQEVRRAYPGSLTILPGEVVEDLHDAIIHCSQVPELVKRGVLVVAHLADKEPEPASKARVKILKDEPAAAVAGKD